MLLGNDSNVLDDQASAAPLEFASKSHQIGHFLPTGPNNPFTGSNYALGKQHTIAASGGGSYNSNEDNSVNPAKTDNTPMSELVFDKYSRDAEAAYGDFNPMGLDTNNNSFTYQKGEESNDNGLVRPSFGNSRSLLMENTHSNRHKTGTERNNTQDTNVETIICTRICNYRELRQLFSEFDTLAQMLMIEEKGSPDQIIEEGKEASDEEKVARISQALR